jgi:hypothetical protein
MRNARRRRGISLSIVFVAVVTLAVTIATHEKGSGPGVWFGVLLVALFTSIFSIVALLTFHFHVRWQQKLERGERLLAKWTVTPAEWAGYRENEKARLEAGRQNSVKVRSASEDTGIAVLVAEDSLMVDDDFFKLVEILGLQYLPETPPVLEYNMVTRGKGSAVRWNIRFPVAAGAEAGARAVWDYVYRAKPKRDSARAIRRFRIWRPLGLAIGIICLPMSVYGFMQRGQIQTQPHILWYLIAGFMGTPFGLTVGVMSHFMLKREVRAATGSAQG